MKPVPAGKPCWPDDAELVAFGILEHACREWDVSIGLTRSGCLPRKAPE